MTETTAAAKAASVPAPEGGKSKLGIAVIVSAVIAAIGIVLWIVQLTGGMVQTGMRNLDSWGLYITCFMFFVGLSAGGLIISSVPRAFGIKGFGGIAKIAVMTSIAATVAAIGFVIVDMGQPLRVWELFAFANVGSPLLWDVVVLLVYLILSCVYLRAQLRAEKGLTTEKSLRTIAIVALVCAVLVHSVTAWIFGLQQGREMWHTALLGPWFVSSALVCGTALVICAAVGLRAAGYLKWEQENLVRLAKLLGAFVMVDLYFFACDLLTEAYPAGAGQDVVNMLVAGPLAPFFWIEIIGCIVCAVICFNPSMRTNKLMVVASILAIVAIFCKRVQLLVGGFQIANLSAAGGPVTPLSISNWNGGALANAYAGMVYWPSPIEFGVTLGVIALGFLVFFLGIKKLPLKPADQQ